MAVSPDEIRAQGFALVARGYDPAEVRSFLARVADSQEAAAGWSEVEERLVLVLEAARRAIDSVRAETERSATELRRAVREELTATLAEISGRPVTEGPEAGNDVGRVRDRLTSALQEVEAALGTIGQQPG